MPLLEFDARRQIQRQRVGVQQGDGHGSSLTLIPRFGAAAHLDIPLHCLVLDGVDRCDPGGAPRCMEAGASSEDAWHAQPQIIIGRLTKRLQRRSVLTPPTGS